MGETQKTEQEWRDDLKQRFASISIDTLEPEIRDVMGASHDYGTVCVAIGAIAAAAARAADRMPNGGITGFQASAVFWEFLRAWDVFEDGPKRMVCYKDMLYPQYADKMGLTISAETWQWLQEEAAKNIGKPNAHPRVAAHWQSIVDGIVPFGYTVEGPHA